MPKVFDQVRRSATSIAKGLGVTLKNYTREKVTLNYPDEKPVLAERYRGLHGLTIDPETGEENCIGCMACARVCPDNLIQMTLEKREGHKGRYPVTFQIDLNPCCFCGLCSEVCPTPYKALIMTHDFELASESRSDLILTKDKLMLYARRDQVQWGHLPEEYPLLSKEQQDDLPTLDEASTAKLASAHNVQEAVAIVNLLNARPRISTPKQETKPAAPAAVSAPATVTISDAPAEPDYTGMDKVARAKAKAAYLKAKRAYDAAQAGAPTAEVAAPPQSSEPQGASQSALETPPVEPDYTGMDKVERAKAKSAYIKAKRAWDERAAAAGAAPGGGGISALAAKQADAEDVPPTPNPIVPQAVTDAAHATLHHSIDETHIAERASTLDGGTGAEAEGLSPETQQMLGESTNVSGDS